MILGFLCVFVFQQFLRMPTPYDLPDLPSVHADTSKSLSSSNLAKLWQDPLGGVMTSGIWVYQHTFSQIQGDVCNFTPSCSHFAAEAIQSFGPVRGLLLASDRLQRCNFWAWQWAGVYYGVQNVPERGPRLLDPVERYR